MKSPLLLLRSTFVASLAALAAASAHAESAPALDDSAIVGIYNQVNSFDIESALLAASRSGSAEVKKLAEMVARDHRGVRLAAAELAQAMGIAESLPAARQAAMLAHDRAMVDLSKKGGSEFDRAYLQHEIDFHEAAINALKTVLLPQTKDARLKAHFESVLPHFEHHLHATIALAQKLGYRS
jgi:putative membrane protein